MAIDHDFSQLGPYFRAEMEQNRTISIERVIRHNRQEYIAFGKLIHIRSLSFLNNGLICFCEAIIWDAKSGQVRQQFAAHTAPTLGLLFTLFGVGYDLVFR